VFLAPNVVCGEIILDDFVDSAIAISPQQENMLSSTQNVGALSANRGIGVGGGGTDPIGKIDSNITKPSALTAVLSGHEPTAVTTARVSFVVRYDFQRIDVTEGGINDAIIFEFESLSGSEGPLLFDALTTNAAQPGEFFEYRTSIPLSSGPVEISMPFSEFHLRASNYGIADFPSLTSATFRFFFLGPNENINWSAKLNRVVFGRIDVPEPSSLLLSTFVLSILTHSRITRKNGRKKGTFYLSKAK
jgi:hypothetical protein